MASGVSLGMSLLGSQFRDSLNVRVVLSSRKTGANAYREWCAFLRVFQGAGQPMQMDVRVALAVDVSEPQRPR